MSLQYMTSQGQTFDLETDSLRLINRRSFRGYAWDRNAVETGSGERLVSFRRGAVVYTATLLHYGSRSERYTLMNTLEDAAAYDREKQTPGRLVYCDNGVEEYISCYIIGAAPDMTNDIRWDTIAYQFYCPSPFWMTERHVYVDAIESTIHTGGGRDYNYGYSYGYGISPNIAKAASVGSITSDGYIRLIAYGAIGGVRVSIGDRVYEVSYPVPANSKLILDTRPGIARDRRIYVEHPNGEKKNVFAWRSSGVFEKVPAGKVAVRYRRTYPIDLTVYTERSEPRWS